MCTGLEVAAVGAILGAGGSAYNTYQSNKNAEREQKASNRVLTDTLSKNREIRKDSALALQDRLDQASPEQFEQNAQEIEDKRVNPVQAAITQAQPEQINLAGSAPKIVQDTMSKKLGDVFQQVKMEAGNLAKLKSTGDTWLGAGLQNRELSNKLVVPANLQRGNLAGLELQQEAARLKARKPVSPVGDIFQGVGKAMGSYGGSF